MVNHNKRREKKMIFILILMIGMAAGYDLKCPAQAEWRFRANFSCYSEDKYVCLFHLLEKRYEENCLGSDLSSIGSKLVFQPLFNLAECNARRFQPVVFTTNGNSECIFSKSICDEEGQIVFSNGTSSNDLTCRCDYTKGYTFVSEPKNSCFCLPSEEDCSCFRLNCSKLSSDYHCTTDGEKMIPNATCQEIYPQKTNNRHNRTVIHRSIKRYFQINENFVGFIISILLPVSIVTVVLIVIVFEYKESALQEKKARDEERIELIQKGECGKHHFARLVFIGKNGVGKTSLMRRLLWHNKKEVLFTQSTDGIEIGKCNINVTNGKWSLCDKIDNDLARLIHQVYREKKHNAAVPVEQINPLNDFVQEQLNFTTPSEVSATSLGIDDVAKTDTSTNTNEDKTSSQKGSDESYDIILELDVNTKTNNDKYESHDSVATDTNRGNINPIIHENRDKVEYFDDSELIINESENEYELAMEKDENINKMTSAIMKTCLHRKGNEQHVPLAFCWLWDFAGEKDYYATHQVFLSTYAVYLLVTDSLELSTAKMLWTDIEDSAQYVNFWFDAIHCYWSTAKKGRLDPPIIVVCTNQDQLKDPSERKKRQDQFKENLGQSLTKQEKKKHLRNLFFVSNTEDDDNVFEEIRQCISSQAMDMKDWGQDCQLKMLLFQQVLEQLKHSNVHISTTKTLLKIAKHENIGISQDGDVITCLQYCHDIGTIIYFNEDNLQDYVILDPQWLVNAFRCLVSDKIENIILTSDDWQTLRETGELTELLISRLFRKEPKLMFFEHKTHLIEVMKRFDIIVNLRNSDALYMPCMMKSYSFEEFRKQCINRRQHMLRTSWLCLDFEFLPPAFFNHILAWYIKQYSVSVILDRETRNERKALYRQIGVFDLDSSGCEQLMVCEGPNVIALQVWNARMSEKTYGDLGSNLQKFVNILCNRYRLRIEFTKTFKCKNGDFTIHRKKMNDLLVKYFFCQEHKTDHSSDDLVTPWDLNEELQRTRLAAAPSGRTGPNCPSLSSNDEKKINKNETDMISVQPNHSSHHSADRAMDNRHSKISLQLPSNINKEAVVWGTFNYMGGRLVLPESGVSLTVPEGAIKKGHSEELFLAVCRDDKDRPKLLDRQTIISPVILCGPGQPGVLKKASILSFQHCANMRLGGWILSLCGSDTSPDEPPMWHRIVTLGQETLLTPVFSQLDPTHCHIMTEQLMRYAFIGESIPGGRAVKILRLAAFAATQNPSLDFSIRVYMVEDTKDALESVIQEENRYSGRLLDKPKQIPFQDGGHNLCLTIEDLPPGWRSKLAANYQEIPFQHIWSGNQNNLHCSFSLEMTERRIHKVSCKIQVWQKAILSNRQVLNIYNNFKAKPLPLQTPTSTLKGRSSTVTTYSSSGYNSMVTLDPSGTNFRLPSHIRYQLCLLLDPPNARGNDWRMLAQALTVDRYVQYFAAKPSPTEHILDLWEARHREESAITDLMNIFLVMGRSDVAAVLKKDMGS